MCSNRVCAVFLCQTSPADRPPSAPISSPPYPRASSPEPRVTLWCWVPSCSSCRRPALPLAYLSSSFMPKSSNKGKGMALNMSPHALSNLDLVPATSVELTHGTHDEARTPGSACRPGDSQEQRGDLRPRHLLAPFSLVLCSRIAVLSRVLVQLVYLGPLPARSGPIPGCPSS